MTDHRIVAVRLCNTVRGRAGRRWICLKALQVSDGLELFDLLRREQVFLILGGDVGLLVLDVEDVKDSTDFSQFSP